MRERALEDGRDRQEATQAGRWWVVGGTYLWCDDVDGPRERGRLHQEDQRLMTRQGSIIIITTTTANL